MVREYILLFLNLLDYNASAELVILSFLGIYVVILPQCLRVVWKKHSGRALFVYLLATSAATFILVTIVSPYS